MKIWVKIITISILLGLCIWVIDTVLDYYIFYKHDFWKLLFLDAPGHEIYIRIVILVFFIIFGVIASSIISKQKFTEKKLMEERDRAQRYLDIAGVMFVALNREQEIILINKKGCDVLGYKEDELIGKNWFDTCIPGNVRNKVKNVHNQVINGEINMMEYFENEVITKNKDKKNILWHNTILKDENGTIIGTLSSGEDVTRLNQIKDEISNIEDFYKNILENILTGVWVADREDKIYYANRAMGNIAGILPRQITGNYVLKDFSEDTLKFFRPYYLKAKNKLKIVYYNECPIITPAGHKTFQSGWLIPIKNNNQYNGMICTVVDDTEKMKVREEILSLSKFPDENPNPVLRVTDCAKIIYSNDAGYELLKNLKKKIDEFLPHDWAEKIKNAYDQNNSIEFEVEYTFNKGRFFSFSCNPIKELGYVNIYGYEITERKAAEADIRKINENLALLIKDRTSQLEAANRELESFSYSVSHDLRSPLRAMDGFSQAVLEDYKDKLDETGKDYLHRIRSASQRMANLIDDILNLSRITRSDIHIERVDLSKIAGFIKKELKSSEKKRSSKFIIERNLICNCDKKLISIVLENLLRNAWKFSSHEKIARIEFGQITNNGRKTFFIRDNGAGFDSKYKDKLFGPFQRLHSKSEFEGDGIGLAIVQRIINKHGGKIWAESEVGQGSVFYFMI